MESVKSFFGGKSKDFITAVDEKSIIIVKELEDGEGYAEMDKLAHAILDTLGLNQNEETHIAYGTIVNELKEVSRSYKEARMALDVGKIFFGEKDVIAYSSLGIGRLIYQLPIPLCKMFIKEIFENKSPDDFDEETLVTIDKFFENSLNGFRNIQTVVYPSEIHWSIVWISYRRVPDWIFVYLKMRLHSRSH